MGRVRRTTVRVLTYAGKPRSKKKN